MLVAGASHSGAQASVPIMGASGQRSRSSIVTSSAPWLTSTAKGSATASAKRRESPNSEIGGRL